MRRLMMMFGLLLAALLGLAACASQEQAAALQVGDQAPEFRLPQATGGEVALDNYLGNQPVLLYFHMAVG